MFKEEKKHENIWQPKTMGELMAKKRKTMDFGDSEDMMRLACYEETVKHLRFIGRLITDGRTVRINDRDLQKIPHKDFIGDAVK